MKSPTKVCKCCGGGCIKKGKRNGKQRFQCKHCEKYQLSHYIKNRIPESKENLLAKLNNEGMGISSISRILHVSKSNVQRIILRFGTSDLKTLVDRVLSITPAKINTDGLIVYRSLIPKSILKAYRHCTNKIESNNLTLRTHMKRLNRKTICFTKANLMLAACLRIYIWRKSVFV